MARYNVVTNFYSSKEEQMRMSIFVSAKTRQEALERGAKVYGPYEYNEPRQWFEPTSRPWSQAAFKLSEEYGSMPAELLVAVRKVG